MDPAAAATDPGPSLLLRPFRLESKRPTAEPELSPNTLIPFNVLVHPEHRTPG